MAKKHLLGLFGLLFVGGVLLVLPSTLLAIDNSWLTASLTLNEQKTYNLPQDTLNLSSITGNKVNCSDTSMLIRPRVIKLGYVPQQETRFTICSYSVAGGLYGAGYLLKNGTNIAGLVVPGANHNPVFAPPYSSSLVELESSNSYGYRVYIVEDAYSKLKPNKDATGAVTYKTPALNMNRPLKNSSGSPIIIDYNTVAFSENGQWMLADSMNSGFVRINLNNGEVLQFANSFSASGRTVYSINAISNDGGLAVVGAMAPFQRSDIYELASCQPKLGQNFQSCNKRDLQQYMNTKRDKYIGFNSVKFVTNEAILAYATYDRTDTSSRIGLFAMDTNGGSLTKIDYLALGDSFSAGEGAYSYRNGTDFSDNRCHTSTVSYPYNLRQSINMIGSMQSIACSGAKIKDIILQTSTESRYNEKDSQAKKKIEDTYNDGIYSNYLPGYRLQKNFVSENKPKIVTMSIGGNDIGFTSIIKKCVMQVAQDCYHYYEDRKEVVQNINAQHNTLVNAYKQIKDLTATDAKIYIVGYPQIAKAGGNCGNNVHFSNEEIVFSNQLVTYLNSVIKMAATHAGVQYVDIADALAGHKLCEAASKDVAINGLTVGDGGPIPGIRYPLATESYHPNALGQRLMSQKIAAATSGLTQTMPVPDPNPPTFAEEKDIELLANAPKQNRTVWPSNYSSSLSEDVLYKNRQATITAAANEYSLAPNYPFGLANYSDPTDLGTATTDSFGNLNATVSIPDSIEPGYHTLHVRGKNILGDDIDLQKIVYIAASETDMNGDGIDDAGSPCGIISESGVDYDEDGIDDACDGQISEPPAKPTPTPEPTPTAIPNPLPSPTLKPSPEPSPETTPSPSPTPTPLAVIISPPSSPEPSIAPTPTPTPQTNVASASNAETPKPAQSAPTPSPNTLATLVSPAQSLVRNTSPVAASPPQLDTNTAPSNTPTYTDVEGVTSNNNDRVVQSKAISHGNSKRSAIIWAILGVVSLVTTLLLVIKATRNRRFA